MEAKSSVVKSKSSNSAKTIPSADRRHKKSRSNAEFQPNVLKKRGVYVEKKPVKMGFDKPGKTPVQEKPKKAPPRPRSDNKRFLASVLNILSKSTAGTQYPENTAKKGIKRQTIVKRSPIINADEEKKKKNTETPKKKPKFRSKALNDEVDKENKQEKVVVLQSKKEMVETPSENTSFNWSTLPVMAKTNEQRERTETKDQDVASVLMREIMEGQKSKKEKRVRIDEPATLVAETAVSSENATEKDKQLYNFFVDLLEKTISVYNVQAEYDKTPNLPNKSSVDKIPLEIDESVAKRLIIRQSESEKIEEPAMQNQFFCLKDLEDTQAYFPPISHRESPVRAPRKKKFASESFSFLKKPVTSKLKVASLSETRRPPSRKEKKKTLLNLFKEQLRMDDNAFEEPQNLYEALKAIAENKRRCQKTIHSEDAFRRKRRDPGSPECMFKRRKVISSSTKSTKQKNKKVDYVPSVSGRYSEVSSQRTGNIADYAPHFDHSHHSLEVYGFDYEDPKYRMPTYEEEEELDSRYHSTLNSLNGIGSRELLDFDNDSIILNDFQNY